jgi:hypothetical protein
LQLYLAAKRGDVENTTIDQKHWHWNTSLRGIVEQPLLEHFAVQLRLACAGAGGNLANAALHHSMVSSTHGIEVALSLKGGA